MNADRLRTVCRMTGSHDGDNKSEKEGLPAEDLPSLIEFYEEIGSTNDRAAALGRTDAATALVCAERQTAGRGRRGRRWQAPAGSAVAMSLLLRPALPADRLPQLTLLAALAAGRAIRQETGLMPLVKWPNDLLLAGRKVCGILVELRFAADGRPYAIVGIGINVFRCERPEELKEIAASLEEEAAHFPELRKIFADGSEAERDELRMRLIARVWHELQTLTASWERGGDLSFVRGEYESQLAWKEENGVLIAADGTKTAGILRGITDSGKLRFEAAEGLLEVDWGELSLRRN